MNASKTSVIAWLLMGLALLFPSAAWALHLEFVQEVPGAILDVTPKRILYLPIRIRAVYGRNVVFSKQVFDTDGRSCWTGHRR